MLLNFTFFCLYIFLGAVQDEDCEHPYIYNMAQDETEELIK